MNDIRKRKELLIILFFLALTTILILLLGTTFSYFKSNRTIQGQIQLGELDFTVETSSSEKTIMPGDTINVTAKILNKVTGKTRLIPFYFRFKITDSENFNANINLNDFILGEDEFYYCKYKILPNANQQLFSTISINKNLTSGSLINVSIYIEAVQSEYQAYIEVFKNAPLEWIEFIENN